MDELQACETQICSLEMELKEFQNAEVKRRNQSIADRRKQQQMMSSAVLSSLLACRSFGSSSVGGTSDDVVPNGLVVVGATNGHGRTATTSPLTMADENGSTTNNSVVVMRNHSTISTSKRSTALDEKRANNLCVECSALPSIHKCRRCKQYVCDMCCATKRGLEMVWWCDSCFETKV